jgi:hypothetical protein
MITIERAVFQQLAAQVHAGLPGAATAISQDNKIQIVEGGNVVEEFSTAEEFWNALARGQQAPVPAEADCEQMVKNAGLKKPEVVVERDESERGNER